MSEQWFGWLRRDGRRRWQRVCGPCATLAECSAQLGDEAKRRRVADRNTCLTTGSEPRDKPAHPSTPAERSGPQTPRPSGAYLEGF